jgi:hypothetical protein
MGSSRRFGLVLVLACAIVYAIGAIWYQAQTGWLIAASVLLLITVAVPRTLRPLRTLWLRFGWLLHVVTSPILLGAFYFIVVTPIGLGMRVFGADPLRLRRRAQTYWIARTPPGPEPRTMPELF